MKTLISLIAVIAFCVNVSSAFADGNEWAKGGTLYNKTVLEWKNASEQNRLATCGNWISAWEKNDMTAKKYKSLDEMKVDAEKLRAAINNLVLGTDSQDSRPINEFATFLALTMKITQ